MKMSNKAKGNAALLMTAVLWGSGFIAQKLGNEVLPPMAFNSIREIMAALVLCPFLAVSLRRTGYLSRGSNTPEQLEEKRRRMVRACAVCGTFMLIGTATQQIGLLTVSAGKSGFISDVYIVLTPLFVVLLGNRVRLKSVLCAVIALAGFGVMSLRGGLGGATAGDWLTLVSAAGFAAQINSVNYFVDRDNDILISVLQMGFAGVASLVISLLTESVTPAQVAACIPILLYSTFIPTAGGYTLQVIGQKYTDASTAALLMSLEAVFAAIFGALFLSEMMSARELAGSAIILAAVIWGQKE